MAYQINNIPMNVARTFVYQDQEDSNNQLNGTPCVELRSDDDRYSVIIDADNLEQFSN